MRVQEISAQGGSKTDSYKHLDTYISEIRRNREKLFEYLYKTISKAKISEVYALVD